MVDNNTTWIELTHNVVSNDWFILLAGMASIISLGMAFFAVNKVKKIDKSLHQKQGGKKNKQAGRDIN